MRLFISLCILALILVGCGGNDAPQNDTSQEVNPEANAGGVSSDATPIGFGIGSEDETDNSIVLVTPQANRDQDRVPLPGTLAYDNEYIDENMGAVFDRIIFVRTGGGPDSSFYQLNLNQDGSYQLNSETLGQVDSATVINLDNILDDINFFGINTIMLGPAPETDKYRYTITVERGDDELTIRAEDGFTPQPFQKLISALMNVVINSDTTAISNP